MNTKTAWRQNHDNPHEGFKNDVNVHSQPDASFMFKKEKSLSGRMLSMRHETYAGYSWWYSRGGLSPPYAQDALCPIQMRQLQRSADSPPCIRAYSRLTAPTHHGCLIHFPSFPWNISAISRCQLYFLELRIDLEHQHLWIYIKERLSRL